VANAFGIPTVASTGSGTTTNPFGIPVSTATAVPFFSTPLVANPKVGTAATGLTGVDAMLAAGNYTGAFADEAKTSGGVSGFLGSGAAADLKAADPNGMTQAQFEAYYAAAAPYTNAMAGQTIAQGAETGGSANEMWGPAKDPAQVKTDADMAYYNSTISAYDEGGSFLGNASGGGGSDVPNIESTGNTGGLAANKASGGWLANNLNNIGLAGMVAMTGGALAPEIAGAMDATAAGAAVGTVGTGVAAGATVGAGLGAVSGALTGGNVGKDALLGGLGGGLAGGIQGMGGLSGGNPITNTLGNAAGGLVTKVGTGLVKNELGQLVNGGGSGSSGSSGNSSNSGNNNSGSGNMATDTSGGGIDTTLGTFLGNNAGTLANGIVGTAASAAAANAENQGSQAGINTQQATMGNINSLYGQQTATGGQSNVALRNALGEGGAAGDASATAAYQAQPGFASTIKYGNQAAERQAASMGNAGNSGTAMAIGGYDTSVANNYYQNYVNNLMSGVGVGENANTALTGAQLNTGGNISQFQQNQGFETAQGYTGAATALSPTLGNLGSLFGNGTNTSSTGSTGGGLGGYPNGSGLTGQTQNDLGTVNDPNSTYLNYDTGSAAYAPAYNYSGSPTSGGGLNFDTGSGYTPSFDSGTTFDMSGLGG
jgi:hypothetical protein